MLAFPLHIATTRVASPQMAGPELWIPHQRLWPLWRHQRVASKVLICPRQPKIVKQLDGSNPESNVALVRDAQHRQQLRSKES